MFKRKELLKNSMARHEVLKKEFEGLRWYPEKNHARLTAIKQEAASIASALLAAENTCFFWSLKISMFRAYVACCALEHDINDCLYPQFKIIKIIKREEAKTAVGG